MTQEGNTENLRQMFAYTLPCCVFTHSLEPTEEFAELAEQNDCPVLQTDLASSDFTMRLMWALNNVFAPRKVIHSVLVEVFGIGVLILGDSGVGKSEAALELIERGHRLIADDAVEIKCVSGNILTGSSANKAIGHHMEIRGIGIINVAHLFGVGAIRDKKQVQLVVELEEWDANKEYDRIGYQQNTIDFLGVHVPHLQIPVKPGRNVPILIETAAMNERLRKMGYYSAYDFNQNIMKWMESESARNAYFKKNVIF
jgi:HPr kinase/phosphorylase